jgi:hypothetical protein
LKLGSSPAFLEMMIAESSNPVLDRIGHLGHDDIANISVLEDFDELVVEKS